MKYFYQRKPPFKQPLSESHLSSMLKNKNNSTILTSSLSATQDHNLKKIFDQRRMAKRIDEYLSGVNPIEVEAQLSEMSNCCEGLLQMWTWVINFNRSL